MNKLNQEVVNQNANITLIGIRQAEISYFSSFYQSFGTQCFLLTGVLAGTVSQTPGFDCVTNCIYFWQLVYNISVAISIALACLVLIATVFISVFGQGLAIRGPPGSMVETVNGMVAEQRTIVRIFVLVAATYMTQLVGMYFIVMDWEWAVVCSVITGIGSYTTYYYATRIYNRFQYDQTKSGWNFDQTEDEEKELSELSPEILKEVLGDTSSKSMNSSKIQSLYQDSDEKKKKVLMSMMKRVSMSGGSTSPGRNSAGPNPLNRPGDHFEDALQCSPSPYHEMNDGNSILSSPTGGARSLKKIQANHLGYLTVKMANPRASMIGIVREKWIRYFFLLKGQHLYFYVDRKAFEQHAATPINSRPIDLEGYVLQKSTSVDRFSFSLVPAASDDIRKTWKFRCDSVAEMQNWIEVLERAIPPFTSTDQKL